MRLHPVTNPDRTGTKKIMRIDFLYFDMVPFYVNISDACGWRGRWGPKNLKDAILKLQCFDTDTTTAKYAA